MNFYGSGNGFHCFETKENVRSLLFCCNETKVNDIPSCDKVVEAANKRTQRTPRQKMCTSTTWNQNGGHNCCSKSNKCGMGEGGCKSHEDCQAGLRCNKGMKNCRAFDPKFPDDANCCAPGNSSKTLKTSRIKSVLVYSF